MLARYDRSVIGLAAAFSAVAGYVDAIGFLLTGGSFVSFMSGNTTRLAIGLAGGTRLAGIAVLLIATFVGGVVIGTLAGRIAGKRRVPAVLMLVTILLAAAAGLHAAEAGTAVVLLMVMAMGAENTVFAEDGEVRIGLTYMTGTLVKLGKRITAALLGGDPFGWLPYLALWAGLLGGAVAGAVAFGRVGGDALWGAVAVMAVLTGVTSRMDFARFAGGPSAPRA